MTEASIIQENKYEKNKTSRTSIEGIVRIREYSYEHSERLVQGHIGKESSVVTSLVIDPPGKIPVNIQFNGYVGSELEGISVTYTEYRAVEKTALSRIRRKVKKEEVIIQHITPLQAGYPIYKSVHGSISLE